MPAQTNQLIAQINLTVDADWGRIRNAYNKIKEKKDSGAFSSVYEPAYHSQLYSMGDFGFLSSNTSLTSETDIWDAWGGKLLEQLLPKSILSLRNETVSAGLNFINFGYYQHHGNISEHVDGKRADEGHDGHCNVNFIIIQYD